MASNGMVMVGAGAVAVSTLLPWLVVPGVDALSPYELLRPLIDVFGVAELVRELPWEGVSIASTFPVAALLFLLAIIGRAPGWVAALCGLVPFAVVALAVVQGRQTLQAAGVPSFDLPPADLAQAVRDVAGIGLWFYVGGSVALLLGGLIPGGDGR